MSTSSEEISRVCKKIPVDVSLIRPDYLVSDSAKAIGVIQYAITTMEKNRWRNLRFSSLFRIT